jgi:AGCS family alanine or glycine:cation symporter
LDIVNRWIDAIVNVVWSDATFVVLLAMGLVLTVWSKLVQYRALTHGVTVIRGKYDDAHDPGAINHFQALSTALSGTVGLGNIAGVALAISVGGPGALFWMWVAGLMGMAIKSVEVTLAMMYRDTGDPDNPRGGAMWVIRRGFGDKYGPIASWFARIVAALFCWSLLLATITSGNMFQSWNVANITEQYFDVPPLATGVVMATMTALVIIGGIRRIGDVTGMLVPFMCGLYLIAGMIVLVIEAANVPSLLAYVVRDAFSPSHAEGAFLGASLWFGITTGLRRALFSNEAGQGTSPIAHSAAKTTEPVREGVVAGLEPFIDTCLVCTLTALVILATGTWNREPIGDFTGIVGESRDVAMLPSVESWTAGDRIFVLGESSDSNANTGTRRVKINGRVELADTNGASDALRIAWQPMPEGVKPVDRGVYRDLTGAALTGHAFDRAIPGLGKWLVTLTCWLFAISTMISWSYYGEQAAAYLFGPWATTPYKVAFCALGVVATLPHFIVTDAHLGNLADLGSGLMLFANVPIIVLLSHRAIGAMADYFRRLDRGDFG